jgi:hypothetical protein
MKYQQYLPEFTKKLEKKLKKGYKEHSDHSFDRLCGDLVDEIEQEIIDICGWSVVLYGRLQELKKVTVTEKGE